MKEMKAENDMVNKRKQRKQQSNEGNESRK